MFKIQRVRAGSVEIGDIVQGVDDESLTTDAEINEAYEVGSDSFWAEVTDKGGHADIGWIDVCWFGGTEERIAGDWDQYLWKRVES
jgi:hypothetical protein